LLYFSGDKSRVDNIHGLREYPVANGFRVLQLHHVFGILLSSTTPFNSSVFVPVDATSVVLYCNTSAWLEYFDYFNELLQKSSALVETYDKFKMVKSGLGQRKRIYQYVKFIQMLISIWAMTCFKWYNEFKHA